MSADNTFDNAVTTLPPRAADAARESRGAYARATDAAIDDAFDDDDLLPPEDDSDVASTRTRYVASVPLSNVTVAPMLPDDAEAAETGEAAFWAPKGAVADATAKAEALGVRVTAREMSRDEAFRFLEGTSVEAARNSYQSRDFAQAMQRASLVASAYARVRIVYPKSAWTVLGMAEQIPMGAPDGTPTAIVSSAPGVEPPYWNMHNIASLDFSRCDKCGVRHARKTVYIVGSAKTGDVMQVGGTCADNLNAGKQVKRWMNAVSKLFRWAGEQGWEEDTRVFRFGRPADALPVDGFIALVDWAIGTFGWVSGRQAYVTGALSTKGLVRAAMQDGYVDLYPEHRRQLGIQRITSDHLTNLIAQSRESGRLAWLRERIDAWFATAQDRGLPADLLSNAVVGYQTGYRKALGQLAWVVKDARDVSAGPLALLVDGHTYDTEEPLDKGYTLDGAGLAAVVKRGRWNSPADFANALGLKPAQVERALDKPDKLLAKGVAAKVQKHPAGTWEVLHTSAFEGQFGISYKAMVMRTDDNALLRVTGTGAKGLETGDKVRFGTVQAKGVARAWHWKRHDIEVPAMLQVTRATVLVDNDLPGLLPPLPPVPVVAVRV